MVVKVVVGVKVAGVAVKEAVRVVVAAVVGVKVAGVAVKEAVRVVVAAVADVVAMVTWVHGPAGDPDTKTEVMSLATPQVRFSEAAVATAPGGSGPYFGLAGVEPFTQLTMGSEWLVPWPSELGSEWLPQPVWKISHSPAGDRCACGQMEELPKGRSGPSRTQGPSGDLEVACTICTTVEQPRSKRRAIAPDVREASPNVGGPNPSSAHSCQGAMALRCGGWGVGGGDRFCTQAQHDMCVCVGGQVVARFRTCSLFS